MFDPTPPTENEIFKLAFNIVASNNGSDVYVESPSFQQRLALADYILEQAEGQRSREARIKELEGALERISRADRNAGASYGWCATEADKALTHSVESLKG
jgi:hypothetical protein